MQILFILIVYLFVLLLTYFLALALISSFVCSRDNIFSNTTSNIIKALMFIPLLNLLIAFFTILARISVFVKEDLEEFNNKRK